MIMKTFLITEKFEFLNNLFAPFSPVLLKVEFVGDVSVFAFMFDNESDLSDNWRKITSSVAAYYQSAFEDEKNDFERWNIYILFIVRTPVGFQLKYKIENDKFSSRKIVHDNATEIITVDTLESFIEKYIVVSDLPVFEPAAYSMSSDCARAYSDDSRIYRLIDNSQLKNSGQAKEREALGDLYQQIIKEIKDEIQESRNTVIQSL